MSLLSSIGDGIADTIRIVVLGVCLIAVLAVVVIAVGAIFSH